MALCRYSDPDGNPAYALYRDGQICPLRKIADDVPVEAELFDRGVDWVESLPDPADNLWESAPDALLPVVPPPQKILCIGLNFRDHAKETGAAIPTEPVVFSKFNTALIGCGDTVRLPKASEAVDYEAEFVVVIGKQAKHVSEASAMDHVFGYTCGNDVSARDWQKGRPGGQWLLGKSFDSFAPIGPCLVTTKEVPDHSDLRIQMTLNGETMQDSSTRQLIFDVPFLVAHLSRIVTLNPGDVIYTGTPPGVGAARQPPVFLKPGDTCTVEIDQIGKLTNVCQPE